MKMSIENSLYALSHEVFRCELLGRVIEMIVAGGSHCTNDSLQRDAVVGALGEALASLAGQAAEKLGCLADEIRQAERVAAKSIL